MNHTNTGGPAFPLKEPMSKEAMKLALEALEVATTPLAKDRQEVLRAQAALREALAEQPAQQQEPVAWMWKDGTITSDPDRADGTWTPLYTSPQPSKPWVGLTDEERGQVINANFGTGLWAMAKDIEAKLKEKNT